MRKTPRVLSNVLLMLESQVSGFTVVNKILSELMLLSCYRNQGHAGCMNIILQCYVCTHFICVSTAWKVIAGPTL